MSDWIERSEVLKQLQLNHKDVVYIDKKECARRIEAIPAVSDRPKGEWKRRLVDNGFNADWVCSECGYRVKIDFVSFNFCPNCGADMRGKDDE